MGGDGTAQRGSAVSLRHPAAADDDSVPWPTHRSALDWYLEDILRYAWRCLPAIARMTDNNFSTSRADVLDRLPAQSAVAPEPRRSAAVRGVHVSRHYAAASHAKFLADDGDFHYSAVLRCR